jgi:CRISPR-associated protein Cmr1
MDQIGKEMVRFRSWGRGGKILQNEKREGLFAVDHKIMKETYWKKRESHPQRIVFGLPHNYGKRTTEHVEPEKYERRASPLFIHIHQTGDADQPMAILTFLPSLFLPEDAKGISVGKKMINDQWDKKVIELDTGTSLWKPINDFLDRLQNSTKCIETFKSVTEVTHE